MSVPQIRISFGEILFDAESKALAEKHGLETRSKDYYFDMTFQYWEDWQKYEKKILNGMQDALGVKFYLPVIDVTCAPFFIPKAAPMIMNFKDTPDRFVDVLTHELCHLILTDNSHYQEYEEAPKHFLSEDWKKLFGHEHEHNTLVHIPVHAVCKYIWLEILKMPERVERDMQDSKSWQGGEAYTKSWEYVNAHDYKKIIGDLKQSYVEMGK